MHHVCRYRLEEAALESVAVERNASSEASPLDAVRQCVDEGGLPGAASAEHRQDLARPHLTGDGVQKLPGSAERLRLCFVVLLSEEWEAARLLDAVGQIGEGEDEVTWIDGGGCGQGVVAVLVGEEGAGAAEGGKIDFLGHGHEGEAGRTKDDSDDYIHVPFLYEEWCRKHLAVHGNPSG